MHSLRVIVNSITSVIEEIPPELISDIMSKGIVLAGGGALARLDKLVAEASAMPVSVAEDPLTCVARGTGWWWKIWKCLKMSWFHPSGQNTEVDYHLF